MFLVSALNRAKGVPNYAKRRYSALYDLEQFCKVSNN